MNNIKRSILVWLCILLILVLTGCSGNSTNSQKAKDSDNSEEADSYSKQKPYTCVILSTGPAADEKDCELVSEAASKITKAKFNTTIKIIRYPYGIYDNQLSLMLATGEQLDLFPNLGLTTTMAANNEQIYPLDDLLKQYGQDLLKNIPESDWIYSKVNGKIYGVRNNKELAESYGYCMRKDILDAMGVNPADLKTEADIEQLFHRVKKEYPDMWAIAPDIGTMGFYDAYFDDLGGDYGILSDCRNDSTTVVNMYETKEYYKIIHQRYEWVKEGLMMPDGSTVHTNVTTLMREGKVFASSSNMKPGKEAEVLQDAKRPVVCVPMTGSFSTTSSYGNQWFIARQSEKPERAMQILNEMYINPELANILINGVEGVHWQLVDKKDGIIDYPKGISVDTSGYPCAAWAWPNEFITYIWKGSKPDLWQDVTNFNNKAIPSPLKGFSWNNKAVLSQIAACNNVAQKYKNALECGELDPSVYLPRFIKELKEAGVDTIIAEKQRQVDEWLKASNK